MMTFVLAVVKFFTSIWSVLWNLITKYPLQCLAVLCMIVLLWFTNKWAVERTTKKLNAQHAVYVDQVEKLAKAREDKITEIEQSSAKAAEEAKTEIGQKAAAIQTISSTYEKRLEEAMKTKKIEYVYIKVPGAFAPQTELIVENGVVACRRFPSQFSSTINDVVDQANGASK